MQTPLEIPTDNTLPASVRAERSTQINRLRGALKSGSSARLRVTMTQIMTLMHH